MFLGCGRKDRTIEQIETVPVDGTVTLNGEPVTFAQVMFTPDGGSFEQRTALGETDMAGHYELSISLGPTNKEGAVPGKYRVSIIQSLDEDGAPIDPKDKSKRSAKNGIPEKYMDPTKQSLSANVVDGGGTIDFELDSK
jgi:hypothetical protein